MSDLITRARALAEKATEGPWRVGDDTGDGPCVETAVPDTDLDCIACYCFHSSGSGEENAAFIAAARTLVPELADALEAAERERDEARAERDLEEAALRLCGWEVAKRRRATLDAAIKERDEARGLLRRLVRAVNFACTDAAGPGELADLSNVCDEAEAALDAARREP